MTNSHVVQVKGSCAEVTFKSALKSERTIYVNFKITHYKNEHVQSNHREYGLLLQGLLVRSSSLGFDYGTYLLTDIEESRYHTAELHYRCVYSIRFLSMSPSVCMYKCLWGYLLCMPVCIWHSACCTVCLSPFTLSTYLDMQTPLWRCEEIWACGNVQVWDPSLSVGLTSGGKDLAHTVLTKPQLWCKNSAITCNFEARPVRYLTDAAFSAS